jgi:hypothetical protein
MGWISSRHLRDVRLRTDEPDRGPADSRSALSALAIWDGIQSLASGIIMGWGGYEMVINNDPCYAYLQESRCHGRPEAGHRPRLQAPTSSRTTFGSARPIAK